MLGSFEAKTFNEISFVSQTLDEIRTDDTEFAKELHKALNEERKVRIYIPCNGMDYDVCKKRIKNFIKNHLKAENSIERLEIYGLTDYYRFLVNGLCFILLRSKIGHNDDKILDEELYMGLKVRVESNKNNIAVVRCAVIIEDDSYVDEFSERLNKCNNITSYIVGEC